MLKVYAKDFADKFELTKREAEVFTLIASGSVLPTDIAGKMGISQNTVRIHIKNVNTKMGTKSKTEFVVKFLKYVLKKK